jgi:hypothetical protein
MAERTPLTREQFLALNAGDSIVGYDLGTEIRFAVVSVMAFGNIRCRAESGRIVDFNIDDCESGMLYPFADKEN